MRNPRKHLVWMLGLALALAATGVANAASTQHIEASVSPTKLDKTKFTKGIALGVHVFTTGASGVGPPGVDALPAETKTSDIDFDKNIKFTSKGLPQCDVTQIGGDTASALATCGDAKLGTGEATGNCVGGLVAPAVVTAFNGLPVNGHPSIILHSFISSPVATTIPLVSELIKSPKSGFGQRLHVPVDPLLGGACTLVDFSTILKRSFKAKGAKKAKKRNYVSARCKSKDKQLHISSD